MENTRIINDTRQQSGYLDRFWPSETPPVIDIGSRQTGTVAVVP
jgi:hypothetical protein